MTFKEYLKLYNIKEDVTSLDCSNSYLSDLSRNSQTNKFNIFRLFHQPFKPNLDKLTISEIKIVVKIDNRNNKINSILLNQ